MEIMQNQAEVVRLESQLTVPSRHRAHLSDLWIAISCTESLPSWGAEFGTVVGRQVPLVNTAGTLEVVAMTERQGWIVARGVDLSRHGNTDIEEMVRSVVARVNVGTALVPAVKDTSSARLPWTRIAAAFQSGRSMARQASVPQPTVAIDGVPGR